MANVRKITHPSGEVAWRATVKTLDGKRKSKNHATKKAADAWARANDGAGSTGSSTMTVLELAKNHNRWFETIVEAGERDQRTADGYDSHKRVHLETDEIDEGAEFGPLHKTLLCDLDTPRCQAFLDRIITRTGSVETARRVRKSLSAWCGHGVRNGWLTKNPVDDTKVVKKKRRRAETRVQIPPKEELASLIKAAGAGPAAERDRAIVHMLMFAGPRISELLGAADTAALLRRPGADGKAGGVLKIEETLCSRHTVLGAVKSEDGLRDVPLGPATAACVRAWRVARGAPQSAFIDGKRILGRLFPSHDGEALWSYTDFRNHCWNPLMLRAGLAEVVKTGRYWRVKVAFGPHTLRHVFASIQIENGITPKKLQELMGHATLAMTMDLYGHLWTDPAGDQALAEAGERVITGKL